MSADPSVPSTARRLAAEAMGTAFLLAAILGSGIAVSADGAGSTQPAEAAAVVVPHHDLSPTRSRP